MQQSFLPACKGPDAEELLLLALRGSDAQEPLRQWLKLLLQSSPKLASLHAMALDQGETVGQCSSNPSLSLFSLRHNPPLRGYHISKSNCLF